MKVACIQQLANDVNDYKYIWYKILESIDEAARNGADIIVLPECAYPAYFLGLDIDKAEEAIQSTDILLNNIKKKAKLYKVYIAIGLAVKKGNDFYNNAILIDKEGIVISEASKSNLWHFDYKWFAHGDSFEVVKTEFGYIGLIICADGRAPEITRILAVKGADIIIDLANLTSTGKDAAKLSNAQLDYMLPVRAIENGVWIIVADKAGLEAESILYSGKSCVINPEGCTDAQASTSKQEILYAEVDLNKYQKNIPSRRPEVYKILTQQTETTPIYKDMITPVVLGESEVQVSVVKFNYENQEEYLTKSKEFIHRLEMQDSKLIVLPQLLEGMAMSRCIEELKQSIENSSTIISFTGYREENAKKFKSIITFSKDMIYGIYDKVHLSSKECGIDLGSMESSVIETPIGKLGFMMDQEGLIPEMARCLMLYGAEIVIWSDSMFAGKNDMIACSRASENKVYLIRAGGREKEDTSIIINTDGRIVATTLTEIDQSASSLVIAVLARAKTVVPGTNVVLGRKPSIYKELIKL